GGNPVACAAGAVVFDTLAEPGFLEQVTELGRVLQDGLRAIGEKTRVFRDVRGRGLLVGAVLKEKIGFEGKAIVDACRKEGVLTHVAGSDVLRLAPPLTLSRGEAETGLAAIERAVRSLVS